MFFDNPCEHNGYVITGRAFELAPGQWQTQLLVELDGFEPEGLGFSPICLAAHSAQPSSKRWWLAGEWLKVLDLPCVP